MKTPQWGPAAVLVVLYASVLAAQTSPNWTQRFPSASPAPRVFQSMAYDSAHNQVVLFGGQDYSGDNYADTWVWDGSNWSEKSPQHSPTAQSAHAMVYDSAHSQAVLFSLNDTWLWDGTDWTPVPPIGPSGRYGHAMAFDSAHGQVVLFGGADANGSSVPTPLADTWVWDGHKWTQKFPQASPSARFQHAMAYDSAHGQVVLYGGFTSNNFTSALGDTWLWDGSNWTQASPQTSPSARAEHAMVYDSAHGQVVLFGGVGGTGTVGDTWTWEGSSWTQGSPEASPPARSQHAMAYDSAHDQVVLFGGASAGFPPVLGDTWSYGVGAVQVNGPSVSGVISASAFGHLGSVAPGSWIEIYGSNLAPDTRGWTSADFTSSTAPTSLDGVSVMVGGQAAFVDYISPTQVNALLPSNIATTGMLLVAITNGGVTSAPVDVPANASQPGLLAPQSFFTNGMQYVVAQLPDGTYVLPAGTIAGVNSRPAKPGETIVIYGIGFGPVMPATPVGEIAGDDTQLAAPLELLFAATQAQVVYAGLAPGFVGLYQFNIVVPDVADNDLVPLTFTLGNVSGTQTLFTAVHH